MKLSRLRFCQESSEKLGQLKSRTGLTPNILARIGFSMSLNEPNAPNPDDYPSDSDREIDRQVLLGQWDLLFIALLKERCYRDGLSLSDDLLVSQFRAHMNRGVMLLHKRIRNLKDLGVLMPREIYKQTSVMHQGIEDGE